MGPIAITFDVSNVLPDDITGGERIAISAWLFFPDDITKLHAKPTVMTLVHGGSYDKRYFHCEIPGHTDYSAAQYLAELGNIVLVPDLLGVGDSAKAANQKKATRHIVALANHAADIECYRRLKEGRLHSSLPAFDTFTKVGVGHSMGGMQIITQQAEHKTYDGVMILGFTTIGVHFSINGNRVPAKVTPLDAPIADYTEGGRAYLHETFHWDDIPPEIIAFDDSLEVPTPSTIGLSALRSREIAKDAARIETPVFVCMGERDVSPDAHAETANYKHSRDVTLHILVRSGHCHNFASTRHILWNRMHDWSRWLNAHQQ
ncbi:MAG: alpha/beta fold hydrolase [Spongiibacteraceae bacterium]